MRMISANFIATNWKEYEQQGPEYADVAKWWKDNADALFGKLEYNSSFDSWKRWYKDMRANEWGGMDKGPVEALAFLNSLHSSINQGRRFRPISKIKNWLSGLKDDTKDHADNSKSDQPTLSSSDLEKAEYILHYYPRFGRSLAEDIVRVANSVGANPYHLANLINFESGGSTSVYNRRGSGAVGLIQFIPPTARSLGTSTDELSKMNSSEQMQYVEKYLKQFGSNLNTEQKLYMAVFFPKWMHKDIDEPFPKWALEKNDGIRTPRDYIRMVNAGARIKTARSISANSKYASNLTLQSFAEDREPVEPRTSERYAPEDVGNKVIVKNDYILRYVDGEMVRDGFDADFTAGGHHYVYPWIPVNEIWIEQRQSARDAALTEEHEKLERSLMIDGMSYTDAHDRALELERRLSVQKKSGTKVDIAKNINASKKYASTFVATNWDEYISQGSDYNQIYQWWLKNSTKIPPAGTWSQSYDDWRGWYSSNKELWGNDKDPVEVLSILNKIISTPKIESINEPLKHKISKQSDLMILGDSQAGGIGAALSKSSPILVYQNGASIKTVEKLFLNYASTNNDDVIGVDTIFIQTGGNDIWSSSLEQMKAAMLSLINSILSVNRSAKIVVGTITPRESAILQKHKNIQESYRQKLINFNTWLTKSLPSVSSNISIFNSNSVMSDPKNPLMQHSQYASEDGVHFNSRGYKYLASNIMEQIG